MKLMVAGRAVMTTNDKRNQTWKAVKKHKYFYLMLIPVLTWYIIFCYGPMYGLFSAFQNYSMTRGIFGSEWVGLRNFKNLFNDSLFWRAFRNSLIISVYRILIEFPIPILLSILMNELRWPWMRKTAQTILYLPHFLSWITVASITITFINPDMGLIAAIGQHFNLSLPPNIITNDTFRGLLVVTNIWKEAGWGMVIYLAAMSSVDGALYEAAYLDGANRLQGIWYITLPSIRSVISIQLILTIGSILYTGLDQVYNLHNPLVLDKGDVIEFYVYRVVTKQGDFGYASALGFFGSLICSSLLLITNKLAKMLHAESIY